MRYADMFVVQFSQISSYVVLQVSLKTKSSKQISYIKQNMSVRFLFHVAFTTESHFRLCVFSVYAVYRVT